MCHLPPTPARRGCPRRCRPAPAQPGGSQPDCSGPPQGGCPILHERSAHPSHRCPAPSRTRSRPHCAWPLWLAPLSPRLVHSHAGWHASGLGAASRSSVALHRALHLERNPEVATRILYRRCTYIEEWELGVDQQSPMGPVWHLGSSGTVNLGKAAPARFDGSAERSGSTTNPGFISCPSKDWGAFGSGSKRTG